jgi:hypothetical protein
VDEVGVGELGGGDAELVPVVLSWNYGGASVSVTGAWDGWREKVHMTRNECAGGLFLCVLYLPCGGEFQFKYYVDENWQCNPSWPTQTDAQGNTNNVVRVVSPALEFDVEDDDDADGGDGAHSPIESYDQGYMQVAEARGDPPLLPAAAAVDAPTVSLSHALVNHLSADRPLRAEQPPPPSSSPRPADGGGGGGGGDPPPLSLATTFRHKGKLIIATYVVSGDSTACAMAGNGGGGGAPHPQLGLAASIPHLAL